MNDVNTIYKYKEKMNVDDGMTFSQISLRPKSTIYYINQKSYFSHMSI
jgi:hypothetical protein